MSKTLIEGFVLFCFVFQISVVEMYMKKHILGNSLYLDFRNLNIQLGNNIFMALVVVVLC